MKLQNYTKFQWSVLNLPKKIGVIICEEFTIVIATYPFETTKTFTNVMTSNYEFVVNIKFSTKHALSYYSTATKKLKLSSKIKFNLFYLGFPGFKSRQGREY